MASKYVQFDWSYWWNKKNEYRRYDDTTKYDKYSKLNANISVMCMNDVANLLKLMDKHFRTQSYTHTHTCIGVDLFSMIDYNCQLIFCPLFRATHTHPYATIHRQTAFASMPSYSRSRTIYTKFQLELSEHWLCKLRWAKRMMKCFEFINDSFDVCMGIKLINTERSVLLLCFLSSSSFLVNWNGLKLEKLGYLLLRIYQFGQKKLLMQANWYYLMGTHWGYVTMAVWYHRQFVLIGVVVFLS